MRTNKIDTIIFDLGAVLAKHNLRNTIRNLGEDYAEREHNAWQKYKVGNCTEQQYWDAIFNETPHEAHKKQYAQLFRDGHKRAQPEDAFYLLEPLKNSGYRLAVLSNHVTEWAQPAVQYTGIDTFCNPIIISSDVKMAKPDKLMYDYALRAVNRLNEPQHCLFIDDKTENVIAARDAGMNAVQYTGKEQLLSDFKKLGIRV